jgi:hypothetical protein
MKIELILMLNNAIREEGSFGNKQASLGSTSGRFLLPELPAPGALSYT